jgi:hypothetical protein
MMPETMPSSSPVVSAQSYPLDIEHIGIRLALPLSILISGVLYYNLLSAIVEASGQIAGSFNCLLMLISLFAGLFTGLLVDKLLKRFWQSGRSLNVDSVGLTLRLSKGRGANAQVESTSLQWAGAEPLEVLGWRFQVKRRSARVQKNWWMLGCRLGQAEQTISVYAFIAPEVIEQERYAPFVALVPRKTLETGDLPLRELNKYRRLIGAEDARWQEGVEMRAADFTAFVDLLLAQGVAWPESS